MLYDSVDFDHCTVPASLGFDLVGTAPDGRTIRFGTADRAARLLAEGNALTDSPFYSGYAFEIRRIG